MQKKNLMQTLSKLLIVLAGNFLYALTVELFLLPSNLTTGGTTGIALFVSHFFPVSVSAVVLIFNVAMLLLGFAVLGRSFAITTIISTFCYPLSLELCRRLLGGLVLTEDLLLCTIFSGLGIGLSLGIVIRAGASTGGMDIPPLVLQRLFRVPTALSMYLFDVCILLSQALFRPAEQVLYGIVLIIIYTLVLDRMLLFGSTKTEVKIVSKRADEICSAILSQVDRGVTLLQAEGGYLHEQNPLLLSVISNRELIRVENLVHSIDPECFMVVSRVSEVKGRGFSISKQYR